ncbi:MAG: phosphoadenosine phosphosulfate reductase, partial [Pelagibaca sp.]|nr:phosphoadenosine phosphosulfate reductase [Pelagibaca sp.]
TPYLRKLLMRLEGDGRMALAERLCENVTQRMDAPRFRRRLEALRTMRAQEQDPQDEQVAAEA